MNYQQLEHELSGKGLLLSQEVVQGLYVYLSLLLKWNRVMNLVGPSDWKVILNDLILDSFYLADFLNRIYDDQAGSVILDLGAGAGLPGIPLRLAWKKGSYYLVESRMKRTVFMSQALMALDLKDTYVLNVRIQEIDPQILPARVILSRAFMPWPELLPLVQGMLDKDGRLVILSGQRPDNQDFPEFETVDLMEYQVNRKKRYFWALAPKA